MCSGDVYFNVRYTDKFFSIWKSQITLYLGYNLYKWLLKKIYHLRFQNQ